MYISTRANYPAVSAAKAIKLGMVPEGGLFVPQVWPLLASDDLKEMSNLSYQELAKEILLYFLDDYSETEIEECIAKAYYAPNFSSETIAPLHKLTDSAYILELFHGPTAAFKDMALQLMPHLLSQAITKVAADKETVILVATSGDTGKAALEGFKDVPDTKIICFYPKDGVSQVQERQMVTTGGQNTFVVAVEGNFDDCQSAVKDIFSDKALAAQLADQGYEFSSANSINWGRLLPQIIYYFASYSQLVKGGEIAVGDKINVVVPTGNFGNILAGYYAYKMGLPVKRFICASNENNVLTDFLATGCYDRNRPFIKTNTPSMDILISSNLERFLYDLTDEAGDKITAWYSQLNDEGSFTIDTDTMNRLKAIMEGGYCSQTETLETIKQVFTEYGYTLDTHTAVAVKVYQNYVAQTQDDTKTIIAATASPFKFVTSVLTALKGEGQVQGQDEFARLRELAQVSGVPVHPALNNLENLAVRHNLAVTKQAMVSTIKQILQK